MPIPKHLRSLCGITISVLGQFIVVLYYKNTAISPIHFERKESYLVPTHETPGYKRPKPGKAF